MSYVRKTYDEFQLMYDYGYGHGLEVICCAETLAEAKQNKREYIENEGIVPIIRKVRVRKEET